MVFICYNKPMFDLLYVFLFFVFGLITGSFLNCIIYRVEKGESFLKGRSYCPSCNHSLAWQDLVPLISFLSLGGRCRYCSEKISWQYPLVELAAGIVFSIVFLFNGTYSLLTFAYLLVVSSFLILIFTYDFKHLLVPDVFVYIPIAFTLIYLAFYLFGSYDFNTAKIGMLKHLFSAFLASGFFGILVLVSKEKWMGSGDIGIGFLMGLILGWPNIIVGLLFSFFLGALVGIALMVLRKKGLKSEIAFGPFLVLGTFFALFLGEKIITWYLNLFLI